MNRPQRLRINQEPSSPPRICGGAHSQKAGDLMLNSSGQAVQAITKTWFAVVFEAARWTIFHQRTVSTREEGGQMVSSVPNCGRRCHSTCQFNLLHPRLQESRDPFFPPIHWRASRPAVLADRKST